jgi:hypothetical protein
VNGVIYAAECQKTSELWQGGNIEREGSNARFGKFVSTMLLFCPLLSGPALRYAE